MDLLFSMRPGCSFLTLILLFLFTPDSDAFPDGAPTIACQSMKPGTRKGGVTGEEGHTASAQNILPTYGNSRFPPYYIQVHAEALTYKPDASYEVSIVANQTLGANMFKGVLMMAYEVTCSSENRIEVRDYPIGSFVIPSTSSTPVLKTLGCNNMPSSAVTHNSPQYKINETVIWRAPDSSKGNLVFRATVVQQRTTFWMDVFSPILRDANVAPPKECSGVRLSHHGWMAILTMATSLLIIRRRFIN